MIIESISPAQHILLNYLAERNERRPSSFDLSARDERGNQRLLIPTGHNTYDVLVSLNLETLGNETEEELMKLASAVPRTYIEKQAPYQIQNTFFIFNVDKFRTRFRRGYVKYLNYNHYRYFWFFGTKNGKDQIMYRIRIMLSRLWNARAKGIERSCKKKHFEPYGNLKAIMIALDNAAKQLKKYSEGIVYSNKLKKEPAKPEPKTENEKTKEASGVLLNLISEILPKVYEPMRTLISIEYPTLCKIDTDPPPIKKTDTRINNV